MRRTAIPAAPSAVCCALRAFDKAFYKANNNLYMRLSSSIPLWLKKKLKKILK